MPAPQAPIEAARKAGVRQPLATCPTPSTRRGPVARRDDPGLVGVLGGMGPLATVDFMRKLLESTPATQDQDHVPLIVSSIPQVPDRTRAFQGTGASPLEAMVASGRRLVAGGARLIVIPCNTAHLWFDELQHALGLPMAHIVDAALEDVGDRHHGGGPIGLLATPATVASGLYVDRAQRRGLADRDTWVLPTAAEMAEWVEPGIAAVKAGQIATATTLLTAALLALKDRGARLAILGCTEIPIALDARSAPLPLCDATAALARRAVAWSIAQRGAPRAARPAAGFRSRVPRR